MDKRSSLFFLATFLFFDQPFLFSQSVVESDGAFIVNQNGQIRKLEIPNGLLNEETYSIRLNPDDAPPSRGANFTAAGGGSGGAAAGEMTGLTKTPKSKDQPEDVGALIFRANQLYKKGSYDRAMHLLNRAEIQEPKNARVQAMKGSLFFLKGWRQLARSHWQKSLAINPNQPGLKSRLNGLEP